MTKIVNKWVFKWMETYPSDDNCELKTTNRVNCISTCKESNLKLVWKDYKVYDHRLK